MVSLKTARELALLFEGSEQLPHFEKASFRVNKKIFLTLDEKHKRACIKLPEIEQDVFCRMAEGIIYPVPNKWGKQGWTLVDLMQVQKKLFSEALSVSYIHVSSKRNLPKKR